VYRGGYVEAVDGVAAGEHVVVRGQARLVDGSVVEVREEDGSRPGTGATRAAGSSPAPGAGAMGAGS
jgi:hypothetical protein